MQVQPVRRVRCLAALGLLTAIVSAGCSGHHTNQPRPRAHSVNANLNGASAGSGVLYARARLGIPDPVMNKFEAKINSDPAAYGLFYRNPERLLGITLRSGVTDREEKELEQRVMASGYFLRVERGLPGVVPNDLFKDETTKNA